MRAKEPADVDFGCPRKMRKWLNGLKNYVLQNRPIGGVGIFVTDSASGKGRRIDNVRYGAGGGGLVPFELVDASDNAGKKIRVVLGSVDFPGNPNPIPVGPYPAGMSEGDDPEYILSGIPASGYVYLVVSADEETEEITSLTIGFYADPQVNAAGTGYGLLGSWTTNDAGALVISGRAGNQAYIFCGGGHYFWLA